METLAVDWLSPRKARPRDIVLPPTLTLSLRRRPFQTRPTSSGPVGPPGPSLVCSIPPTLPSPLVPMDHAGYFLTRTAQRSLPLTSHQPADLFGRSLTSRLPTVSLF